MHKFFILKSNIFGFGLFSGFSILIFRHITHNTHYSHRPQNICNHTEEKETNNALTFVINDINLLQFTCFKSFSLMVVKLLS